MAFTAFVSRSKPGNQAHNEREFDADHPEPDYFLPAEHRRPNIHITQDLTAKQVYRDYVRTSDYGRKAGRLHHSAKPVREAIIVCKMDTTEEQVRDLIGKLEKGLGIRALYAHVHKDEGHIDEKTGKVKYNPHIHFGYTNLVIERDEQGRRQGELTDMNRPKMRKAQDICAEALGMERAPHYTKRTRKKNLSHQAFRAVKEIENRVQAALDAAEDKPQTAEEKTGGVEQQVINLVAENTRLRNALKNSGIAKQKDYQGLKQIKDSDLPEEKKVVKMAEYVDRISDAGRGTAGTCAGTGDGNAETEKSWRQTPHIHGRIVWTAGAPGAPEAQSAHCHTATGARAGPGTGRPVVRRCDARLDAGGQTDTGGKSQTRCSPGGGRLGVQQADRRE